MSISTREILAVMLAILFLAVGLVVSYYWPATNASPRSGSLVVCIGIFFALRELRDSFKADYDVEFDNFESKRAETDIVPSEQDLKSRARGTTDYAQDVSKSRRDSNIRRVMTIDTSILIFGTIVWGFGDLLFECEVLW